MDTTIKVEVLLPEADMPLLKALAKKCGWQIKKKKSGIQKGLDDIAAGRVSTVENVEDLFKQISD